MNDFPKELKKHLEFIRRARGRVLVTGLGLGCVIRGLIANDKVDHIDVVERSRDVIKLCWPWAVDARLFKIQPLVTLHQMDANRQLPPGTWDYAWHDLWSDPERGERHLQVLHSKLFTKLHKRVRVQGAWAAPRWLRHRRLQKGFETI